MPRLSVALACLALSGCTFYLRPQCNDGAKDGEETDVDCGGTCGACALGRACGSSSDCESGNCASGRCRPPPCENGVRDGVETDVDCGGAECRKCAGGRKCLVDADCYGGQCVEPAGTCYQLATVSFVNAASYPSGEKAYNVFSGDLDDDGHLDLVSNNELESTVAVFLGKGDGTFQRAGPSTATGAYPTGGALRDFDGDGFLDVATANFHGNSVSVLRGLGDGTLAPATDYPTEAGAETTNLAVGDIDGNGRPEVVATNQTTGSASLFMGQPGGGLGAPIRLTVGTRPDAAPFSAALADLDGDGFDDVAIAEDASLSVSVRLSLGDGTLGPEALYPEGGLASYVCIASDVTLDGHLDLVCANRSSDDVSVLPGRGDGTLGKPVLSSTGVGTGPYALAVADFNLDGVPDVVTANYLSNDASVLLGVGDGSFEPPLRVGPLGQTTYGVTAGDFDEDGRPDFAVSNAISNDVVVVLSTAH